MAELSERLQDILVAIVGAYRSELESGRRETLMHLRIGGIRETIQHHAWPDDAPEIWRADLEELHDLGLVDIEFRERAWMVRPTAAAVAAVEQYERELLRQESARPVDLRWDAVRPVLHAIVDVWEEGGASANMAIPLGLVASQLGRDATDLGLVRAIEQLAVGGWVETTYGSEHTAPRFAPRE
jgi:hypothetical protein